MPIEANPSITFLSNSGTARSLAAAIGTALGASACCTIPLAVVSLGIGGAWIGILTALAPYRWIFVGFAVGALGYAAYTEWRLGRRPDCDCQTLFSSATRGSLLGVGTLVVLAAIVSPWLVASSPSASCAPARPAQQMVDEADGGPRSYRQVVLGGHDVCGLLGDRAERPGSGGGDVRAPARPSSGSTPV